MCSKEDRVGLVSFQRPSESRFRGSRVTSDAGLIPVREFDARLEPEKLIAERLRDSRQALNAVQRGGAAAAVVKVFNTDQTTSESIRYRRAQRWVRSCATDMGFQDGNPGLEEGCMRTEGRELWRPVAWRRLERPRLRLRNRQSSSTATVIDASWRSTTATRRCRQGWPSVNHFRPACRSSFGNAATCHQACRSDLCRCRGRSCHSSPRSRRTTTVISLAAI